MLKYQLEVIIKNALNNSVHEIPNNFKVLEKKHEQLEEQYTVFPLEFNYEVETNNNLLINEDNIVEIYENTKTKKTSFLNLDLIELNDIEKAKEILESLGVDMNPSEMVSNLKTSEKQLLEICKALYSGIQAYYSW